MLPLVLYSRYYNIRESIQGKRMVVHSVTPATPSAKYAARMARGQGGLDKAIPPEHPTLPHNATPEQISVADPYSAMAYYDYAHDPSTAHPPILSDKHYLAIRTSTHGVDDQSFSERFPRAHARIPSGTKITPPAGVKFNIKGEDFMPIPRKTREPK